MNQSDALIILLTGALLVAAVVNTSNNAKALEIAEETHKLLRKEETENA